MMKVVFDRKKLASLLSVIPVGDKKADLTIRMAKFDIAKNMCTIRSVNSSLSVFATTCIECNSKDEFSVLLDTSSLLTAIKSSDAVDVDIEVQTEEDAVKTKLKFANGKRKSSYSIPSLPCDNWIEFPVVNTENTYSFDAASFNEGIDRVAYAASDDIGKQVLNVIRVRGLDGFMEFTATDGHVLSLTTIATSLSEESTNKSMFLIGKEDSDRLKKILSTPFADTYVSASIGEKFMHLESGSISVDVLTLSHKYPDVNSLFPSSFSIEVSFDAEKMIKVLDRLASMVDDTRQKSVSIKILPGSMTITVNKEDLSFVEELDCETEGITDEFNIGFSLAYLRQTIKPLKNHETVSLNINKPNLPVTATSTEDKESHKCLIMPVIIRDQGYVNC